MAYLVDLGRPRAVHWAAAAAAILLADYLTGPFIQFLILLVLPVGLATVAHGKRGGAAVAVLLPLLRLSFYLEWDLPASWPLEIADTAIDVGILLGFVLLIDKVVRQHREILVLKGLLPICGFCKRIRDEGGRWQPLESFISARSGARFSHTVCRGCGRKRYPGLVGEKDGEECAAERAE